MNEQMAAFVELSRRLGNRSDFVQGGGGNTSIKLDAQAMAVKASGTELAAMTADQGFVLVDYPAVCQSITAATEGEVFLAGLSDCLLGDSGSGRPSIETGFHALLGSCVIHTHSVYANVLNCAREGMAELARLFPAAIRIPYHSPGLPLTRAIQAALAERTETTQILFLQNHGLIVAAPTPDQAWQEHEQVNERIVTAYDLPAWLDDDQPVKVAAMAEHVLFPDQVVFTHGDAVAADSRSAQQTARAHRYIQRCLQQLGWSPRCLDEADVAAILGMSSEQYRQRMAQ